MRKAQFCAVSESLRAAERRGIERARRGESVEEITEVMRSLVEVQGWSVEEYVRTMFEGGAS